MDVVLKGIVEVNGWLYALGKTQRPDVGVYEIAFELPVDLVGGGVMIGIGSQPLY